MALSNGIAASFRAAVKAHNADAVATAYKAKDVDAMLAFYNATAAGPVKLWRPDVKPAELASGIVMSGFVAMTAVQQNGMLLLLQLGQGGLDATNANVRASFSTLFSVASPTTLTNLTNIAQRPATNFEAIAAFLTSASGANVCDPAVYGKVLTRVEIGSALWDDAGNPL